MIIRKYKEADRDTIKHITVICFEHVTVEANIEKQFGTIAGKDWKWRKARHIDWDIKANADGIFVAEEQGQVIGYITTRIDNESTIGWIPNLAVLPEFQKSGIGRKLIDQSIQYCQEKGMEYVRIETLDQNKVGLRFYPKYGFQEVARQVHFIMPV